MPHVAVHPVEDQWLQSSRQLLMSHDQGGTLSLRFFLRPAKNLLSSSSSQSLPGRFSSITPLPPPFLYRGCLSIYECDIFRAKHPYRSDVKTRTIMTVLVLLYVQLFATLWLCPSRVRAGQLHIESRPFITVENPKPVVLLLDGHAGQGFKRVGNSSKDFSRHYRACEPNHTPDNRFIINSIIRK